MTYIDFLKSKIDIARDTGFDVAPEQLNPVLFPHDRDAVRWALKGGRRALFEKFGLHKTLQQLEFHRIVTEHEGGRALIVLPLGVKQEFERDAIERLGWDAAPPYVRNMKEVRGSDASIIMTNYERVRDGDIDPQYFVSASLDEAAVLRSFGSKTYQSFLNLFKGVPYKVVATATPDPNRTKELIHYAGFLEIMDTGQALTRFFQRDSSRANNLTLYPHKEDEFWLWVSSWALFISKPSDLGYSDEGYNLPPLEVRYHEIAVDHLTAGFDRDGQGRLIRDAAMSLPDAAREKRESIQVRVAKAKELVDEDPGAHFILWHDLEDERHAIAKAFPESVAIWGTMDLEERERRVIDFSDGKIRLFATKKELSGCGCNFQNFCHRAIFLGIDDKFHDFIQAIHRIYRFRQTEPVRIDVIYTESEREVLARLRKKWEQFDRMQEKMREIIRKYGLSSTSIVEKLARSLGVERTEVKGKHFRAILNDCVLETPNMPDNSIDLIVTSIPFSNHYEYTPLYNDFGHNPDTEKFMEQMDFLSPELLRILRPGRVMCVHVKDRVLYGNATGTGMPTMEPFHALCTLHFMRHGFQYFGMITVVTDVVRENNQTYRLGWTECCKDGTKMGVGCPEYILLFRKLPSDTGRAYADVPVVKTKEEYPRGRWQLDAHAFWRSSGNRLVSKEELLRAPVKDLQRLYRQYSRNTVYSYEEHVELAQRLDERHQLPATFMVVAPGSWTDEVWDDINRMRTLNTSQSRRMAELHICPLQIDIVERLINRYSNPGEVVFDPFAGLGTVPKCAVEMGREGIGIELNTDSFRDMVGYLKEADEGRDTFTLFDLLDEAKEV